MSAVCDQTACSAEWRSRLARAAAAVAAAAQKKTSPLPARQTRGYGESRYVSRRNNPLNKVDAQGRPQRQLLFDRQNRADWFLHRRNRHAALRVQQRAPHKTLAAAIQAQAKSKRTQAFNWYSATHIVPNSALQPRVSTPHT